MAETKRTHGPFDVSRKIPLGAVAAKQLQEVVRQLRSLEPVLNTQVDKKSQLHITYDASRIGMREIEALLDESGIKFSSGYWSKLKQAWYRFLDDNARANARSDGACCNRPPSMHHSRDSDNARRHD